MKNKRIWQNKKVKGKISKSGQNYIDDDNESIKNRTQKNT